MPSNCEARNAKARSSRSVIGSQRAGGHQHTTPARGPQRARNLEERRFSDPRLPAHDQAGALFARAPKQIREHCHLANPSDKCGHIVARRGILSTGRAGSSSTGTATTYVALEHKAYA